MQSPSLSPPPPPADSTPPPTRGRPRATSTYLDSPSSILPITVPAWNNEASSAALRNNQLVLENIGKVLKTFCPILTVSNIDDLNIKQLGGGLSNTLYLVGGAQEGQAVECLVRVHSDSDVLIEREEESAVAGYLSERGLAPRFFGRFTNGRVEEVRTGG